MQTLLKLVENIKPEQTIMAISQEAEDLHLIRQFVDVQSEVAFTKLMRKYQSRVYWLARRTIFDHYDADEVTQQVFIILYKKLHQFNQDSTFYTWLFRITSNQVLQFLRTQKLKRFVGLDSLGDTLPSDTEAPTDQMEKTEWGLQLQKVIATLPPQQRLVFNMRYYEEMPYEQIAETLGKSVGAMKANYFHAVQKVKEKLSHEIM